MTGIFLLFLLIGWIGFLAWMADRLVSPLKEAWKWPVRFAIWVLLIPLPLADELLSKAEFKKVCQENAQLVLDDQRSGEKIAWFGGNSKVDLRIGALDGSILKTQFVDIYSGQPVFHYGIVSVKGGWLVSSLKISETQSPLLFASSCRPEEYSKMQVWQTLHEIREVQRFK